MRDFRYQMSDAESGKTVKLKRTVAPRAQLRVLEQLIHNSKERAPYVVAVKQDINPVNSVG